MNNLHLPVYLSIVDTGRIGRTFKQPEKSEKNTEIDFDVEALSMSMEEEEPAPPLKANTTKIELTYNEVKDCRWFHDTPGIIKDECVSILLNLFDISNRNETTISAASCDLNSSLFQVLRS